MKKSLVVLLVASLGCFCVPVLQAANAQFVKGTATVPLKGKCRKDVPRDNKIFQAAFAQAKIEALRSYSSNFSRAKQDIFNKVSSQVEQEIDDYFANPSVVGQRCDPQTKTFTIVLRGQLNVSKLTTTIDANMAQSGPRGQLVALFLARETESVVQKKVRDTVVTQTRGVSSDDRMADVTENSVSSERVSSSMQQQSTGGSRIVGSDKINWVVSRPGYVETSFNAVMTGAKFRAVPAFAAQRKSGGLFNIDAFQEEFGTENNVSADTMADATDFLNQAGIKYFVVGTMDVGAKNRDPVSGQVKVAVSISATVTDVSGFFPEVVASVGPVTLAALGQDQDIAKKNALVVAAERAADEIVASLQSKGI